jgi:hypothetical protein
MREREKETFSKGLTCFFSGALLKCENLIQIIWKHLKYQYAIGMEIKEELKQNISYTLLMLIFTYQLKAL